VYWGSARSLHQHWLAATIALCQITHFPAAAQAVRRGDGYVDILRLPDFVTEFVENETVPLARDGARWSAKGIAVQATPEGKSLPVRIEAPAAALSRIRLRWRARVPERWRILDEQGERSYDDLEWRRMLGERLLPWYFLAFDGQATHGYGVATGAASFAFRQVDPAGIRCGSTCATGEARCGPARACWMPPRWSRAGRRRRDRFRSRAALLRHYVPQSALSGRARLRREQLVLRLWRNCSAADIERDSALMAELAPREATGPSW